MPDEPSNFYGTLNAEGGMTNEGNTQREAREDIAHFNLDDSNADFPETIFSWDSDESVYYIIEFHNIRTGGSGDQLTLEIPEGIDPGNYNYTLADERGEFYPVEDDDKFAVVESTSGATSSFTGTLVLSKSEFAFTVISNMGFGRNAQGKILWRTWEFDGSSAAQNVVLNVNTANGQAAKGTVWKHRPRSDLTDTF